MSVVKMFVMDVDGTLTDGRIILGSDGTEYKSFHVKDGMGIKQLIDKGIIPVIITGRQSAIVEHRAQELGIVEIHQKIADKKSCLANIVEKYQLDYREVAYIGDDVNDYEVMEMCGYRFAVSDAVSELKKIATHITTLPGGKGAVREAIELVLQERV